MRILFLTDAYPRTTHPNAGVFVYNLVQEFVKQGHDVHLIAFQGIPINSWFRKSNEYGEELADVKRFRLITASAIQLGKFNTYSITLAQKVFWVRYAIKKHFKRYDIVYCHFIESAIFGIKAIPNSKKPFFVAVGENKNLENYFFRHKSKDIYSAVNRVNYFIAVSEIIRSKLKTQFNIPDAKICVEPNATNLELFKPANKSELRVKYGFPLDAFIVIFVGRFLENKGPLRVLAAVKDLPNTKIIFVGEGPQFPKHQNIIFNSKVTRSLIPELLNCANVFVLPTLHEGSSNAIVEAMACGLPIVSSNIPEIRSQCSEGFSILIDPLRIDEIKKAILFIKDNPEISDKMSVNAIHRSLSYDIKLRASRILEKMQICLDNEPYN